MDEGPEQKVNVEKESKGKWKRVESKLEWHHLLPWQLLMPPIPKQPLFPGEKALITIFKHVENWSGEKAGATIQGSKPGRASGVGFGIEMSRFGASSRDETKVDDEDCGSRNSYVWWMATPQWLNFDPCPFSRFPRRESKMRLTRKIIINLFGLHSVGCQARETHPFHSIKRLTKGMRRLNFLGTTLNPNFVACNFEKW